MDFEPRDRYTVSDLAAIMALLRSPGGCPWDRAQTHASIRKNVIEEAYEVADAIDRNDAAALCEELGDLLLQVVFHSRMSEEAGEFTLDDVADGICRKLILRHPHIFGEKKAESADEVLDLWNEVKAKEKGQTTATKALADVPKCFPALMRSQKLLSRAARAGFHSPDAKAAIALTEEKLSAFQRAAEQTDVTACEERMGDFLFSAVQTAQLLKIDAEESLSAACERFFDRFARMEALSKQRGIDLTGATADQLRSLWEEADRL